MAGPGPGTGSAFRPLFRADRSEQIRTSIHGCKSRMVVLLASSGRRGIDGIMDEVDHQPAEALVAVLVERDLRALVDVEEGAVRQGDAAALAGFGGDALADGQFLRLGDGWLGAGGQAVERLGVCRGGRRDGGRVGLDGESQAK